MTIQKNFNLRYTLTSTERSQENSTNMIEVKDIFNSRERSNMDLNINESTICLMNDRFIKIDMIN
jgi:hypothetical protein